MFQSFSTWKTFRSHWTIVLRSGSHVWHFYWQLDWTRLLMVWDLTHPHIHTGICLWCLIAPLLHISDVSDFCTCSRDFCFAHHMIKEVIWYHLAVGNMNGDMPPTALLSVSLRFGAKACKRKSVQCIFLCCLITFKQPNVTLWVLRIVILGVRKPHSIMIMYLQLKEDKEDSE